MSRMVKDKVMGERRRGERVHRILALRHRLVRPRASGDVSKWSLSSTKDMSHSGLLFLSSRAYAVGDIVELQVVMSGVIDIYNGRAKVVRVTEISAVSFDIGVKYILPKPSARCAKSHLKT